MLTLHEHTAVIGSFVVYNVVSWIKIIKRRGYLRDGQALGFSMS